MKVPVHFHPLRDDLTWAVPAPQFFPGENQWKGGGGYPPPPGFREVPILVANFRPPDNAPRRRHRKFCTTMRERGSRQHSSSRRCQTCVHCLHSNVGGGLQGGSGLASCLNNIPCFGKKYLVFGSVVVLEITKHARDPCVTISAIIISGLKYQSHPLP